MKHAQHTGRAAPPAPSVAEAATTAAAPTAVDQKSEFVRQAAYFYYEARGSVGGHELDDWIKAEAEFERLNPVVGKDQGAGGH